MREEVKGTAKSSSIPILVNPSISKLENTGNVSINALIPSSVKVLFPILKLVSLSLKQNKIQIFFKKTIFTQV